MIRYIQIENFKSLKKFSMPLENLNLLFGMNGMGKSSVIQSFLLLRQSFWENHQSNLDYLYTNGELTRLGTAKDVLCQNAEAERIRFYVQYSESLCYDFLYEAGDSKNDQLKRFQSVNGETYETSLFTNEFIYLGAEHLGPRKQYSTENWKKDGVSKLGVFGEFVVPFLAVEGETIRVPENMCLKTGKTNRLIDQVSAWMSKISPGIKLSAELLPLIEKAKLNISYSGGTLAFEPFLPVNVGFGISYVLPLIVDLLISSEKSLVLIENPESHLHPKGQTAMAELIALAAENGCQILCESHSDHIINGIRVAVRQGLIDHQKLMVSYFSKNEQQETVAEHIRVDKKGALSKYPDGLLDEWGILMSELI